MNVIEEKYVLKPDSDFVLVKFISSNVCSRKLYKIVVNKRKTNGVWYFKLCNYVNDLDFGGLYLTDNGTFRRVSP